MKFLMCVVVALLGVSCAHQQSTKTIESYSATRVEHHDESVLKPFYSIDPAIRKYLKKSVGYVVYPRVEKGAIGVGGAFGKGKVYEKSPLGYVLVGTSELIQVSAGLQLGGQSYSQIIFFGTKKAFDEFKRGETQLSANASAVILKKGKSHGATYKNGTAIVILKEKGLMGELSVGGQKLSYKPLVSR